MSEIHVQRQADLPRAREGGNVVVERSVEHHDILVECIVGEGRDALVLPRVPRREVRDRVVARDDRFRLRHIQVL